MKTIALPKLSTPGKLELARAALTNNLPALSKLIAAIPGSPNKVNTTKYFATRFLAWFEDQDRPALFSIFAAAGNKKLPFYAFSSLPGFDCPGAGACLFGEGNKRDKDNFATGWCYSFKGWRYPAAFFRQLQNSVLMRSAAGRLTIQHAFNEIPENKVLRLYVDGDFSGRHNIVYWMELIRSRPDVQVYGYSKSWHAFIALQEGGFVWPANYKLNLSSGSKYNSAAWLEKMNKLSCVRGSFVAVPVARKHITSKAYQDKDNAGSKEYRKDVLEALKEAGHEKRFACPGNCGNCLTNGRHACGDSALQGVTIGIGVHN